VDFEATCDSNVAFETYPHEIIEFPAVIVDTARDFAIVGEFRSLVRPKRNPILSSFCTTLTSITQTEINHASPFPAVMRNFHAFLQSHKLLPSDLAFERACAMRDDEMPALPYIMPPSPDVFFNEWKIASNAASQTSVNATRSVAQTPSPATPAVVTVSADGSTPAAPAAEAPPPPLAPFALVTDGPTDFRRFLASDCKHNDMQIPFYFRYEMRVLDLPKRLHFSFSLKLPCALFPSASQALDNSQAALSGQTRRQANHARLNAVALPPRLSGTRAQRCRRCAQHCARGNRACTPRFSRAHVQ
jgi:inhibitor of KinA sporulation pathway (predicted exonuclease)